MARNIIVNNKLEIVQGDDQIFRYTVLNKASLDIETVQQAEKIGDEWDNEQLCANLIDVRNMIFVDAQTRNYSAQMYRKHVAGVAIIIESSVSTYFANFYLKFSRPKIPTRLFTSIEDAETWLLEQIRLYKK